MDSTLLLTLLLLGASNCPAEMGEFHAFYVAIVTFLCSLPHSYVYFHISKPTEAAQSAPLV